MLPLHKALVDWFKLVKQPEAFDHPSQEQNRWRIFSFLWMKDLQRLSRTTDELSKLLYRSSAPGDVKQRSVKPHGLLAGLVKNRALTLVRAAPPGDGSEALRQLILLRRLNTQARGPALLSSVTAWPGFVTNKPLQAQLPRHNPNCEYQAPPKARKIQHGYGHWKLDKSPDSLPPLPRSPLHASPVLSFPRLQGPPMSTAKMSWKKIFPRGRHLVPLSLYFPKVGTCPTAPSPEKQCLLDPQDLSTQMAGSPGTLPRHKLSCCAVFCPGEMADRKGILHNVWRIFITAPRHHTVKPGFCRRQTDHFLFIWRCTNERAMYCAASQLFVGLRGRPVGINECSQNQFTFTSFFFKTLPLQIFIPMSPL